ncbi:MAG TPA: alpha/beta hydrolase [Nitrososphaeraceae archaeon]
MDKFAQNYRVISYSRRYAYPNQWICNCVGGDDRDNTIPNNVKDLAELIIKRLNLGSAHIIGHSYGAFIALYLAFKHPELVKTLVLGEPPILSLLEGNPYYSFSKDADLSRENELKHSLVQEAIYKRDIEKALGIFLDVIMGKEGYFYQVTQDTRAEIMNSVKSLIGELSSITQRFTCEDARRVRIPTLLLKGEQSPKILHHIIHIIDILSYCMPNNEQSTIFRYIT